MSAKDWIAALGVVMLPLGHPSGWGVANGVEGIEILPVEGYAVQMLPLPFDAYRRSSGGNLSRLRVVDGSGAALPRAIIEQVARPVEPNRTTREVPFYRLPDPNDIPSDIAVLFAVGAPADAGIAVEQRVEATASPEREAPLAYLLDTRDIDGMLETLYLSWPLDEATFVTTLEFESSDDLDTWQRHGEAVVAILREADRVLARADVDLGFDAREFLRLRRKEGDPLPLLNDVHVTVATPHADREPEPNWRLATAVASDDGGGAVFDAGAALPVRHARIELLRSGRLARIQLDSGPTREGPWRSRFVGLVYGDVQGSDGDPEGGAPIDVGRTRDRYWKLTVRAGGELGVDAFAVELGWVPHRLYFVTSDIPPLLLVAGSSAATESAFALDELEAFLPEGATFDDLRPATTGSLQTLGPPPDAASRFRIGAVALWVALTFAVAVLAWMSLRLIQAVRAADESGDSVG